MEGRAFSLRADWLRGAAESSWAGQVRLSVLGLGRLDETIRWVRLGGVCYLCGE